MARRLRSDPQRKLPCPLAPLIRKHAPRRSVHAPAAPAWLRPLLLALTAILFLTWFTGEVGDTDIWLHLMTGRHTLETRALTVPDPFSYTSNLRSATYPGEAKTRYFNLTHEWLAQILMYVIHSATGFPGLVLLRALLLIVFCGLVGLMVWWRTSGFYRSLAARDRRRRGGHQFPAEPAVPGHLRIPRRDHGDSGAPPLDVGAGPAFSSSGPIATAATSWAG